MIGKSMEDPTKESLGNLNSSFQNDSCKSTSLPWRKSPNRLRIKSVVLKCDNCDKLFHPEAHYKRAKIRFCSKSCFYNFLRKQRIKIPCDLCGKMFHPDSHYKQQNHHFCSKQCFAEYFKSHKLGYRFPKGNPHHWKKLGLKHPQLGSHHSEETKRKLAEIRIAQIKEGRIIIKGKVAKLSTEPKSKGPHLLGQKGEKKLWLSELNKILKKGENNPNWRGGSSLIRDYGWNKIRKIIWERDKYKCQKCGKAKADGVRLVAHHKVPYVLSKDNTPENLITLCDSCHREDEWKLQRFFNILPERFMTKQQLTLAELTP